jgi:hypothetical protein
LQPFFTPSSSPSSEPSAALLLGTITKPFPCYHRCLFFCFRLICYHCRSINYHPKTCQPHFSCRCLLPATCCLLPAACCCFFCLWCFPDLSYCYRRLPFFLTGPSVSFIAPKLPAFGNSLTSVTATTGVSSSSSASSFFGVPRLQSLL